MKFKITKQLKWLSELLKSKNIRWILDGGNLFGMMRDGAGSPSMYHHLKQYPNIFMGELRGPFISEKTLLDWEKLLIKISKPE